MKEALAAVRARRSRLNAAAVFIGALALPMANRALATDFTWNPSAFGTLFHSPINWLPFQFQPPIAGPPGPTEMATFAIAAGNGNYTVTFGTDPANTRCRIGDDHVLFDLAGHTYTLTSTTDTSITLAGIGFTDDARLTLSNGTLAGRDAAIGASNFSSAAQLIVGSGAAMNLAGTLSVGKRDNGSLTIQSGGDVSCVGAVLGELVDFSGANGNGTATVTGAGSTWTISDSLIVGNQGPGSLTIQSGGQVLPACPTCIDQFSFMAPATPTTANIIISGDGSKLHTNMAMTLGSVGSGTVHVSQGATLITNLYGFVTGRDQLAVNNASQAQVTITGPGTSWTAGASVNIGGMWQFPATPSTGVGHLIFSDGAVVQMGGLTLGLAPSSTGTAQVTGDASLDAAITLSVGARGSGTLTINTGGDVTTGNVRIGSATGATGSVTVDGAGSTLTGGVDFTIGGVNTGVGGNGSLTISNGAVVTHQADSQPHFIVWNTSEIVLDGGTLVTPTDVVVHGQLRGSGAVNANVTSDGVVAPGNSPGTLNVTGTYTQQAPGALNIDIGGLRPGTQHDRLNVTGDVTLGGTLNLSLVNGFVPAPNQQFVIINSSGGAVTGTFATVNPPNTWDVIYTAQNVIVQLINDCPADVAPAGGDNAVNVNDLLAVINNWGSCALPCPPQPPTCAADIAPIPAGDCLVNVNDLLAVINNWGACP